MANNNIGRKIFTVVMVILAIMALFLAIDIVKLDTRIYQETMEHVQRYPKTIYNYSSNTNSAANFSSTEATLSGTINIVDDDSLNSNDEDDGFVSYDGFDEYEDNTFVSSYSNADVDVNLITKMVEHELTFDQEFNSVSNTSVKLDSGRKLADWEIDLICMLVQHEVGNDPTAFAGQDFNRIQKLMARVIKNRLGMHGWYNIADVITAPNQFCPIEDLYGFDPYDSLTRKNVFEVVNGTDGLSENVLYEMSWNSTVSQEEAVMKMKKLVGTVYDVEFFYLAKGTDNERLLAFACQ